MEKIAVRTKEAAEMLSISVRHLANLVKSGEIPKAKSGEKKKCANLFLVSDLKQWLENRKVVDNGQHISGI